MITSVNLSRCNKLGNPAFTSCSNCFKKKKKTLKTMHLQTKINIYIRMFTPMRLEQGFDDDGEDKNVYHKKILKNNYTPSMHI